MIVLHLHGQIALMAMEIREEEPRDRKAVYDLVSAAFGRSAEAELVERLREDRHSVISLVADENGRIVGHILLSKMEAPFPALALAPISVIPTRQRSGIGSALITEAIHRARSNGWGAVFVLGDPKYYERFGFDREAAAGFTSPYAGPHFLMLELQRSHTAKSGELRHAPAFAALD
ncbi:MAG TPA: N-acetyltransferase [Terriglobales bacterium]|nr:N-acetyltransferase [Terriglobales bacterium]